MVFSKKFFLSLSFIGCLILGYKTACWPFRFAVEYNAHSAPFWVALEKGWFREAAIEVESYEAFLTGTALAAALQRKKIEVAYMCLAPALLALCNANVPLRCLTLTHRYGYGLVVDPSKVKAVEDLSKVKVGCLREGTTVDLFMKGVYERYGGLQGHRKEEVLRMNPFLTVLALSRGQIGAAFLPEHWVSLAEQMGFKVLLSASDVFPKMPGSVLVVTEGLPAASASKLKEITERATRWLRDHPEEGARILSRHFAMNLPVDIGGEMPLPKPNEGVFLRAFSRMAFDSTLTEEDVKWTLELLLRYGYVSKSIDPKEVLWRP